MKSTYKQNNMETQLTKNFTLEEFERSSTAEQLGIDNRIKNSEPEIISNIMYLCKNLLQPIRDAYGKPITITSGYRCSKLNEAVIGAKNSQHCKGQAADIKCESMYTLWTIIMEMIKSGKIEVDQAIDEKKLSWIHLSLNKSENRNQILHL